MHRIWSLAQVLTAQRLRVRQPGGGKRIYLTFDDGPHPEHTPALLDLLGQSGVKVTFFLLGQNAQAHPEIVRRIVAEGHAIGNHSMTHPNFRVLPPSAQIKEIEATDAVLAPFDGQARHVFRPPRGNATMTTILRALWKSQPVVLWSFDSEDYHLKGPDLIKRLDGYAPAPGDILLFHDDMPSTIPALREMLPRWRAAGFGFGTA